MSVRLRVALSNLGCRVNRVELDEMASALLALGAELVEARDAQVIVVNTCAVTGEAQSKCRKSIRHALALPAHPQVVATGCAVNLFAEEFAALGERVHLVPDKSQVAAYVANLADGAGTLPHEPAAAASASVTPTGRMRPGIKVQDGCDRRCTYCIVWKARGAAHSLPVPQVIERVRAEAARGAAEVVLTGINLAAYRDESQERPVTIAGLLDAILERTDIQRVRLSSVEPPEMTRELFELMAASEGRVAPYLHLPLQAGCDATLRAMGRAYSCEEYARVVDTARSYVPELGLACDLIVGFPGEDDAAFAQSYDFCERMAFAHMHIFRYSMRPGTPAAARGDQVAPEVKAARAHAMDELAQRMSEHDARQRIGKPCRVVVERPGRGTSGALFQVLVDDSIAPGQLVQVVPHALDPERIYLDARRDL